MITDIEKRLFSLSDDVYGDFIHKLTPTLPREYFIGIKVPLLRSFAHEMTADEKETFLQDLPHKYYEGNLLHSILLSGVKDYDKCLSLTEQFLPEINSWGVCDTLKPRAFQKNTESLLPHVKKWISSPLTYTCRFGIDSLMTYYLDENFKPEYLSLAAEVKSDEYYVKMMVAWYFATALAKQWDFTVKYIEEKRLAAWTHNKTIQKAVESFRITPDRKEYLRTLKVK